MTTFVIVGGGLAGAKAAETLRGEGFDGEVGGYAFPAGGQCSRSADTLSLTVSAGWG